MILNRGLIFMEKYEEVIYCKSGIRLEYCGCQYCQEQEVANYEENKAY